MTDGDSGTVFSHQVLLPCERHWMVLGISNYYGGGLDEKLLSRSTYRAPTANLLGHCTCIVWHVQWRGRELKLWLYGHSSFSADLYNAYMGRIPGPVSVSYMNLYLAATFVTQALEFILVSMMSSTECIFFSLQRNCTLGITVVIMVTGTPNATCWDQTVSLHQGNIVKSLYNEQTLVLECCIWLFIEYTAHWHGLAVCAVNFTTTCTLLGAFQHPLLVTVGFSARSWVVLLES